MSDPQHTLAAHGHSAHGDAAHGHAAEADHGHDTHAVGEVDEILAPDEQPTPMWLPVLGAGLFLVAFILFAAL